MNSISKKNQWINQLTNSSHIGLLVVDRDRNNLFVNKHLCEMFGYDKETLLQTNAEVFHVTHDTFLKFAELAFNSVLAGTPLGIDYQFKRKDGSLFWVHISGDPISSNKEVLWSMVDVTKRIEADNELKNLKERVDLALLGNHDGVWDLDLTTNKVYYSPRWKEMLGYNDDELTNEVSTWEKLVHPDDKDSVWQGLKEHIDGNTPYYEDIHRLKHKNGSWVWVRDRGTAVRDEDGNATRMIGTHTDVTIENNRLLQIQEQSKIIEQIHDSVISTDLEGIITNYNYGSELLLDYSKEEIIGKSITTLYPEEDLEEVIKSITLLKQRGENRSEVRLIKKSGTIIDVDLSLSLLKNEDGKPIGMIGYSQDITKRKRAEEKLAEQHKYLQSILDGVDDPIMVIKDDYSISIMNDSLRKNLDNLNIADKKNPKCYEVSHQRSTPCDGAEHPCPLKDVLEKKEHTVVVHNHIINGEIHHVELSATPLFDANKNCIGIIESSRDITSHLTIQEELRAQKNILYHQAHHDALTGLANRILFSDRLEQAIKKAKRNETKTALLFIDLDHFKEINDSLGHAVGDKVLKAVTKRLIETVREDDSVARLGGDEFTIILNDLTQGQDASALAQKILQVLTEPIVIDDNELYVSSSIGISLFPDDGTSTQDLLKYADAAMYKAKAEGRNNYQFYSAEMTELAFERVVMEASLRAALKSEDFVVYYQPQVDGTTNKLVGMEALVRWNHPAMGIVSPAKFIPLAESTGLIVELDRFVMKTAMTQLAIWYKEGLNPGILAMNLAVKQLQQEDFIPMFKKLIIETGCKKEWIALEVTESQIMTKPEAAITILNKISDLGIELAVDDFGTGYSSLAYLKRLPIDKLKIDQSFVMDLPYSEEDSSITKAVIALGKSLNLKIIAEGVETKEQRDFIVQNGCNDIQGYFYSKPVPADEFKEILLNGFKITL